MPALISLDRFREEARAGGKPAGAVLRVSTGEPKALSDGRRGFRFCFSDGSVDRMGDTISPTGWDLHDFNKNPVALWAHDSSSPPIGRASNIMVEGERLMGDIEFAPPEVYAFAETIYRLVEAKFINATSVGFLPKDWKWADDDDEDRRWGIDFSRQELLEISIVPVPANANALIEARAKGIDVRPVVEWAEKILDGGGRVMVPKLELARLRKDLSTAMEADLARLRKKPEQRADDGGISETNPSAGGSLVGNCGRDASEECGMKNPEECAIHGQTKDADGDYDGDEDMDERAIAAIVRREVRAAMRVVMRTIKPVERAEGGDPDDLMANEHIEHMKTAHFHAKECVRCLKKAIDATSGDEDSDVIPSEEPNPEGEKLLAARRARAAQLRAAAA